MKRLVALFFLVALPASAQMVVKRRAMIAQSDTTAPEAISDLAAGSPTSSACLLSWTAPHEDGASGGAVSLYDCRVCTQATCSTTMDDTEYGTATALTGEPSLPAAPGGSESFSAGGLSAGTAYVFGCKSTDDASNVSAISNSATCTTSSCSLPDSFATNDLATCYTVDYVSGVFSYDGASQEIDYTNNGNFEAHILRWSASLGGVNGHASAVLKNWSGSTSGAIGIMFRGGATAGTDKYEVVIRMDGARIWFKKLAGQTPTVIAKDEGCGTWATGDTMGLDWTGTGASTVVNVWHNPAGSYGAWGAASCSFHCGFCSTTTTTNCSADGDCPGGETCNLTACVDSGNYAGLAADMNDNLANGSFDDFTAASP